ncbi:MAG: glycosyltransferase [Acidobacteriota bacterium]|nr:glycosyltransferase [Blastocatellia bacterium]MDW8238665.1 glycosyltransferase [Acidobacteriota bacterium]
MAQRPTRRVIAEPQRQKLLILRPTMGQGGADRITLTLLSALDRRLFDLSLALLRAEGDFLADVPDDVPITSLNASSVATGWLPLARLLRATEPDILFSTSSGANLMAVLARQLVGRRIRLVLSERNVLFHGPVTMKRRVVVWLKRWLYRRADLVTAVSEGVKQDLVARLGLPPQRILVVYNPVVTDELESLAAEPVTHPWFEEDRPIILGVGRLIPQKDFQTLIRAFAQVRRAWDARLVILGEGPLRQQLLQLANACGVAADVSLPGFDKNPFKYMARCTLFVLSSTEEGLPGALIQAMACGAAVISTDCPAGPSEIITPGRDGRLVPVGDVHAMATVICELLENPLMRQRLGEQARQAAQRFAVGNVMDRYLAALLSRQPVGSFV